MNHANAYRAVRTAMQNGLLVRPADCQRCGVVPAPASDGRSTIHAHHHDYSKPLDVEWICAKCHRAETRLPEVMGAPVYGERNGMATLTDAQVAEIIASPLGCLRLGRAYGVNKTTIQRIRRGIYRAAAAPPAQGTGEGR